MAIERAPRNPVQQDFRPANGRQYHVRDGDNWVTVAKREGVDVWDLIDFNFHTRVPSEVNWYLRRNVGCRKTTRDGKNYVFSSDAAPGIIYLPPRDPGLPPYEVPNVTLIPQDNANACWYASARMVVEWRRETDQQTRTDLRSPAEVPQLEAVHQANDILQWSQMLVFASQLGLVPLPLATPTPRELVRLLRTHGPIWTDGVPVDASGVVVGTGHVVVLAGIRPSTLHGEQYELLIYDPLPVNTGTRSWRPASHLSLIQEGVASNPARNVSFLVAPPH